MDRIKIKKMAMILAVLTLLITLINAVSAIGVAPARKIVDFEPGLKTTIDLLVINNEHKDLKAVVFAKGELSEYITFKKTLVSVSAGEAHKTISYELNLPEDIGNPGVHDAEIIIMEQKILDWLYGSSEKEQGSQTEISAVGAVASQLQVRVPYPGKYAEARMYISDADVNKPADFTIQMYNFGKERIEKAKADIEIFGATYERIATIETNEISIEPNNEGKLVAQWTANVNPGVYHAVAVIEYDDKKIRLEGNFNVGKMTVEIKEIEVKDFRLGDVAKFDLLLENRWNEMIPNIYADLMVMDKKGSILTKFKTESIDINAMSEGKIRAYWDTEGVSIGAYDIMVVLNYADKSTERLFEIDVNIDSIRTRTPVARVIEAKGSVNKESVLVVLVIVLIAINAGWFVYLKRKKK